MKSTETLYADWKTGNYYACYVRAGFMMRGLSTRMPKPVFRKTMDEIPNFTKGDVDLTVEGFVIEVKSRKLDFKKPQDIPAKKADLNIDTIEGWDAKERKPFFVINISQITKRQIWLDVKSTRSKWIKAYDVPTRNRDGTWDRQNLYRCHKMHWRPIEELYDLLTDFTRNGRPRTAC